MAFSKSLAIVLIAALLISSTMAQSPASAPSPSNVGGRRISPASSPTTTPPPETSISPSPATAFSPESSTSSSPPSPPQDDSTSDSPAMSPSAIFDSPTQAPGPMVGAAVSNTVFGSMTVFLIASVLVI